MRRAGAVDMPGTQFASVAGMPDDTSLNPAWDDAGEAPDELLAEPITESLPVDFVLIDVEEEQRARRRWPWPWIAAIGGAITAGVIVNLVVRARR